VLRGDEFNSVMEQAPRLAKALADGLGVTTGELRKMAEAGQLSSETVIRALQGQARAVETEFGKLPATIGGAITKLQTQWQAWIGDLDQSSGTSAQVAAGIEAIAKNFDQWPPA
jgi:phage-related minor tail protein